MKKLAVLLNLLIPAICFAQESGIKFNTEAKWKDMLAEAKASHKLIFVDVYTSWCGPCKEMDATVFPQKNVGVAYNASFINTRFDAEKGEGIDVKKKYLVDSYPTYLFIDGDGVLIYRANGSMPANDFIKESKNALSEVKESQTIVAQEALYPEHKTDKDFVYQYLEHLTRLRLQTEPMLDDYLAILSKGERADSKNILLIANNGSFLNRKIGLGIATDVLKQNTQVLNKLREEKNVQESYKSIESNAAQTSLSQAIKTKNEALFKKVQETKSDRKDDPFNNKQTLAVNYYFQTANAALFKKEAKSYATFLLKFPTDTLNKWDDDIYYKEKAILEKENNPKYNNPEYIYTYRRTQTIQLATHLSQLSEQMMELKLTPEELNLAKVWSLKSVSIAATDKVYYQNWYPVFQKNHAIALYKSNQKKAAITELKQSIAGLSEEAPHEHAAMEQLLSKMQKNERI